MPLPGIIMRHFFFLHSTYQKVLRIHCAEWDSRLCETRRIYPCLLNAEYLDSSARIILPFIAGLTWETRITSSKKATMGWGLFLVAFFEVEVYACEPHLIVFLTYMYTCVHTFSSHKVGHRSRYSKKGIMVSRGPDMDYTSETCCSIAAIRQYLTIPDSGRPACCTEARESGQMVRDNAAVDVSHRKQAQTITFLVRLRNRTPC